MHLVIETNEFVFSVLLHDLRDINVFLITHALLGYIFSSELSGDRLFISVVYSLVKNSGIFLAVKNLLWDRLRHLAGNIHSML